MKKIIPFLIILLIYGCNRQEIVHICGDHVCINKAEAKQYFEDNLSLEVKIVDKKKPKEVDLVELNLRSKPKEKKKISLINKKKTKKKLKILSKTEIQNMKAELKKKQKDKKKEIKNVKEKKQTKLIKPKKEQKIQDNIIKENTIVNKPKRNIADICTIIQKCSIDEISKYLIKQGKEKRFPDITKRE